MRPALQLAARAFAHWPLPRGPATMVLAYHRVVDERSGLAVTPGRFAEQMAWLANHRRRVPVLPLPEAIGALDDGSAPGRSVVVTFDDAWADTYTHALEVLIEHDVPATLYVPSGKLDHAGYLRKAELLAMVDAGVTVGAHTRTHPDLRACSSRELDDEIRGSREDLEDLLGRPVDSFAYPAGLHDDRVVEAVARAGYSSAVTTSRGWLRSNSDLLRIPRNFVEDVPLRTFAAGVQGGFNVLAAADALKSALHGDEAQPVLPS